MLTSQKLGFFQKLFINQSKYCFTSNINNSLKDIVKNFVPVNSNFERLSLLLKSAFEGFKDPTNGNAVSEVGDLSNMNSLGYIKEKMKIDKIGKLILDEKPRIRDNIIDLKKLKEYDENTLGKHYYNFMSKHEFKAEERPLIKYYDDLENAYILQRYREVHDFFHVLLEYDIEVVDEIAIKIYESLHLKLPSCSISALFASLKLFENGEIIKLTSLYIPHIKYNAENNKFLMNVYFEKLLDKDINEVRKSLNLIPLNEYSLKSL